MEDGRRGGRRTDPGLLPSPPDKVRGVSDQLHQVLSEGPSRRSRSVPESSQSLVSQSTTRPKALQPLQPQPPAKPLLVLDELHRTRKQRREHAPHRSPPPRARRAQMNTSFGCSAFIFFFSSLCSSQPKATAEAPGPPSPPTCEPRAPLARGEGSREARRPRAQPAPTTAGTGAPRGCPSVAPSRRSRAAPRLGWARVPPLSSWRPPGAAAASRPAASCPARRPGLPGKPLAARALSRPPAAPGGREPRKGGEGREARSAPTGPTAPAARPGPARAAPGARPPL